MIQVNFFCRTLRLLSTGATWGDVRRVSFASGYISLHSLTALHRNENFVREEHKPDDSALVAVCAPDTGIAGIIEYWYIAADGERKTFTRKPGNMLFVQTVDSDARGFGYQVVGGNVKLVVAPVSLEIPEGMDLALPDDEEETTTAG